MIKIALYGDTQRLEQIKSVLLQCLSEKNISISFYITSNTLKYMTDILNDNEFKLQISYLDGEVWYIIKICKSTQNSPTIFGKLSFPPTPEEINEMILKNYELSNIPVHGKYTVKSGDNIHKNPPRRYRIHPEKRKKIRCSSKK